MQKYKRVLHLLFLPVNEVPVVREDCPAPFPELQEDRRYPKCQNKNKKC